MACVPEMTYFAHSGSPGDVSDWQSLSDHLEETAALAEDAAARIGLPLSARLAALLHDFGKHDPAFQRRLRGDPVSVDHSTAGAHLLLTRAAGALRPCAEVLAPGGADRNSAVLRADSTQAKSPPPGGADRNRTPVWCHLLPPSRPHPGARIETL